MLISLLAVTIFAQDVNVTEDLGLIIMMESEIVKLNLYDYFSGQYLNFQSNSSHLILPGPIELKITDKFSYSKPSPVPLGSMLLTISSKSLTYLIDFQGSSLYLFSISSPNLEFSYKSSIDLGFTIRQVSYWAYENNEYLLVLCQSSKNLVFLLDFPDILSSKPIIIPLWDLYYINELKTCDVFNSTLVPFIGTFYSDLGAIFVYDFSEPLCPYLVYFTDSLYDNFYYKFVPVDLKFNMYDKMSIQLVVLLNDFGLEIFYFEADSSVMIYKLKMTQFSCLNSLNVVTNKDYTETLGKYMPLAVATCKGVVIVDLSNLEFLFFLEGITNMGVESEVLNAVSIGNYFFYMLNNYAIVIAEDRGLKQDIIYYLNLTEYIKTSSGYSKWSILLLQTSFVLIQSDGKIVNFCTLSFSEPITEINGSCGEEDINVIASNSLNKSAISMLRITQLENFDTIELVNEHRVVEFNNIQVQVIFEGFSQEIDFPVYDYVSGRNMSFEYNRYHYDDYFSIVPMDFSKVSYFTSININDTCQQVLATLEMFAIVCGDIIKIYDSYNSTLKDILVIDNLQTISIIEKYVYIAFYNNSGNYIEAYGFEDIATIKTQVLCKFLITSFGFIICAGENIIQSFLIDPLYLYDTYTFNSISKKIILSIALSFDFYISITTLYVLTNDDEIFYFDFYSKSPNLNISNSLTTENCKTILANSQYFLYTINEDYINIYSKMEILKTIPFDSKITSVFLLRNFLYVTTEDGELILVDSQQSLMNSYYWETFLSENCTFASAWFKYGNTYFGLICKIEGKDSIFKIYLSKCPQPYHISFCTIDLPIKISLNYPNQTNTNIYPQDIIITAKNNQSNMDLIITLNLVVYGQAVALINPNSIQTDYHLEYNVGLTQYMLDIFTGNNLELSLIINNNTCNENSLYDPLTLKPNLFLSSYYNSSDYGDLISIASLFNTPIIAVATSHGQIIFLNTTTDVNNKTMKIVGAVNIKDYFGLNAQCKTIDYITNNDQVMLIASICEYQDIFQSYWQGTDDMIFNITYNTLIIWEISKFEYKILNVYRYKLSTFFVSLKVITNSNQVFTIILLSNLETYYIAHSINNDIYRMSFVWSNTELIIQDQELINFYSLGLNSFYIFSVDGFYTDTLYISVAEYWHGLFMLKVSNGITRIHDYIKYDIDNPLVSIGMAYRSVYTVSQSGLLTEYHVDSDMKLKFYVERFPFTTITSTIQSAISSVFFSEDYYFQYLVYPVIYDYNNYKFRIIDTFTSFSSCLIRDVLFLDLNVTTFYNPNSGAVFVDQNKVSFIVNNKDIVCLTLNEYVLEAPQMSKEYYKKMVDKWNTSDFVFTVIGENDNNKLSMGEVNLKITMKKIDDHGSVDTPWWMFLVIAVGSLIVLTVTVKIVYVFIFRRWKKRKMRMESLVEQRLISAVQLNCTYYEET
ncbi:hypothetical protein SteCoe_10116 [Stentor coeruleus]|uniref:Uncharacterized protein n=1 Tax=Stentor coeruleus TaxID=5963 RepID=A0A1R2CGF2_9CILI|nr:hypothetical protein SteCoe_10116 [Stentor coeruleus]